MGKMWHRVEHRTLLGDERVCVLLYFLAWRPKSPGGFRQMYSKLLGIRWQMVRWRGGQMVG